MTHFCEICTAVSVAYEEVEVEPAVTTPGRFRAPRRMWLCVRHAATVKERLAQGHTVVPRVNPDQEGLF